MRLNAPFFANISKRLLNDQGCPLSRSRKNRRLVMSNNNVVVSSLLNASATGWEELSVVEVGEKLSELVDEIAAVVPSDDDFSELMEVDCEVRESVEDTEIERLRVYSWFVCSSDSQYLRGLRGQLVALAVLGQLPEFSELNVLSRLGFSDWDELLSVVQECDFFIPSLVSEEIGAEWIRIY